MSTMISPPAHSLSVHFTSRVFYFEYFQPQEQDNLTFHLFPCQCLVCCSLNFIPGFAFESKVSILKSQSLETLTTKKGLSFAYFANQKPWLSR